jgi:hypothetical protein
MTTFARALLEICNEEGNTTSIESIRNAAFAKIASGEVKSLISSTLNGKSFNYQISLAADVVFTAATWAIRQFNKGVIVATQVDFTLI